MRSFKPLAAAAAVTALFLGQLSAPPPASAEPTPTPPPAHADIAVPPTKSAAPEQVPTGERAGLLGTGWESSADRAVATSGDASGFHVLVADAKDGYRWRTAASLSEPGFDTDAWIGNMCVTASGKRAVVVYAPRTFTNKPDLADRGGFTAIVDLDGGPVRKLAVQTTLAYFNPGCGPSETAILTQSAEEPAATRLLALDTAKGTLDKPIQVPGQLTSAVPTPIGIVAADAAALVRVAPSGKRTLLARAKGVPYRLTPDADGGLVYAEVEGENSAAVRRVSLPDKGTGTVTTLATGALTELSVRAARGGQVVVTGTGKTPQARTNAAGVMLADVGHEARPSLSGRLAVTSVLRTHTPDPRVAPADPTDAQRVDITATSLVTNKTFTLAVTPTPGAGGGAEPSPALGLGSAATAGGPNQPDDDDRAYCSVPRNDPRMQAMQPKPRQVEWAVDQAVRGVLTVQRPANWKNLPLPAYTPQGLFPPRTLEGGGYVPAQVLLGIAAQESNMWQAARFAVPGMTANPLIGNYYGIDYYNDDESDDWHIRWDKADCGYGVMQITDGMRKAGKEKPGEVALPSDHQKAIALDFAANIARGLQMLQDKWNETRRAGLIINNGSADRIENWFFAVWAYNSGFHPNTHDGSPWGVGWFNNPVNPRYPADRNPFLETSYADAAEPQKWPYPEKVMGWAGHPIELIETPGNLVHGYRAAWWLTEADRTNVRPPVHQFCDESNQCYWPEGHFEPDAPGLEGEPAGPCAHKDSNGKYDLKCWYHQRSQWIDDCQTTCGRELLRFDPGYPYQEDATSYAPNCGLTGLPQGALIVDNLHSSVPSVRPNCDPQYADVGSFQFTFQHDLHGNYPGKIDVHQIGSGFAGQFWMSNTIPSDAPRAVGTWTLNQTAGWARVLVHLPVIGARTQQARYEIDLNGDRTYGKKRYLPQQIGRNGWVSLGVYNFNGTIPSIRLSNVTDDGKGTVRVAWDAIAIQMLNAKPKHIVAALGDSYSSGEGAGDYFASSDADHGTAWWNACRRSNDAYSRKVVLPGGTTNLGTLADRFDANHELGFVACSGAMTWNAAGWDTPRSWDSPGNYKTGEGQFHEMAQVKSGVLDGNTTLVTLTLGGNDVVDGGAQGIFSKVVSACLAPGTDPYCASATSGQKAMIGVMVDNVEGVIREIRTRAQNAKIVLLGYPVPISLTRECAVLSTLITPDDAKAIADLVTHMGAKQKERVDALRAEGIPVYFAQPGNEFLLHGVCDSDPYINGITTGPRGEGDFHVGDDPSPLCIIQEVICMSRESFHPNDAGTSAYARALRAGLDEAGYRSP
ncbi:SGNH/GDSL hydrolase family protein [Thermoactinospora rubra]|uniref:SGNH/GDSL hydrolase family protein n=1 Tax=Thermoactinospora rubra TaxID=1088767 RepID=UPI00117D66D1|nr:GDSL-type esterase/lipase family protein [Thermoactinospora rubra]